MGGAGDQTVGFWGIMCMMIYMREFLFANNTDLTNDNLVLFTEPPILV